MRTRLTVFFVLFALLPGLGYHHVQDDLRALAAERGHDGVFIYLLGVAPNFLGALSVTAGLIVIGLEWRKGARLAPIAVASGLIALLGLWVWEIAQLWLPNGTFDWHDIAWTPPGVALALLAAGLVLRPSRSGD